MAASLHKKATTWPKSPASPIRINACSSSPYRSVTRGVRWRPGCTLFTVTPSRATSSASVFKNAVAPARAVFDKMSCAIGWRTASEVIATTRPHRRSCMPGTAALHIATTDIRFRSIAAGYASTGVDAKLPGGGPPALATRMSTAPSASAASVTNPVAPAVVETSAMMPTHPLPISAAASARRCGSRPQIATCTPSAARAFADASPNPDVPAATAARRPLIPRSMAATVRPHLVRRRRRAHRWVRSRPVRS